MAVASLLVDIEPSCALLWGVCIRVRPFRVWELGCAPTTSRAHQPYPQLLAEGRHPPLLWERKMFRFLWLRLLLLPRANVAVLLDGLYPKFVVEIFVVVFPLRCVCRAENPSAFFAPLVLTLKVTATPGSTDNSSVHWVRVRVRVTH